MTFLEALSEVVERDRMISQARSQSFPYYPDRPLRLAPVGCRVLGYYYVYEPHGGRLFCTRSGDQFPRVEHLLGEWETWESD